MRDERERERERDKLIAVPPPSDKVAGQNVMEGDPSEELVRGSDRGVRKRARVFMGGLNS